MTYPEECHGVSFEIFNGDWYSDPSPPRFVEQLKRASYWRDEHPLGITDFRFTIAVSELKASTEFFADFLMRLFRTRRIDQECCKRRSVLSVANMAVELLAPTGEGTLQEFLRRYGERIRSLVFDVADLGTVKEHFSSKGVTLITGDAPGSLAVPPGKNFGVLYQFTSQHREAG